MRQLRLVGSCASAGEYGECISLMESGAIKVAPLISAVALYVRGQSGLSGSISSDHIHGDVDFLAAVCGFQLRGNIRIGGNRCFVCSKLSRDFEFALLQIEDKDLLTTKDAKGLNGEQSNHARGHDQYTAVRPDLSDLRCMDCDRYCFDQSRLLKRKGTRQPVHDVFGNGHIFGKGAMAAIVTARDAKDLTAIARVNRAHLTEATLTARDGGIEGDSVSYIEGANLCADPRDDTCCFMAHNQRRDAAASFPSHP